MKTKPSMAVFALLMLCLAPTASAFYNPSAGRWLSRDPIGEQGGKSLYLFVGNCPPLRSDFRGLMVNHCRNACDDALRLGLDKGAVGGVICCDGQKYSCVWRTEGSDGTITHPRAQLIFAHCVLKHEDDHHDDVDCPKIWCSKWPSRPGFKRGKDEHKEECSAYRVAFTCLNKNISLCDGDLNCESQVRFEIAIVANRILTECFR